VSKLQSLGFARPTAAPPRPKPEALILSPHYNDALAAQSGAARFPRPVVFVDDGTAYDA
jgi:hypothetical protein